MFIFSVDLVTLLTSSMIFTWILIAPCPRRVRILEKDEVMIRPVLAVIVTVGGTLTKNSSGATRNLLLMLNSLSTSLMMLFRVISTKVLIDILVTGRQTRTVVRAPFTSIGVVT